MKDQDQDIRQPLPRQPREAASTQARDVRATPIDKPTGRLVYTVPKGANLWPSWFSPRRPARAP